MRHKIWESLIRWLNLFCWTPGCSYISHLQRSPIWFCFFIILVILTSSAIINQSGWMERLFRAVVPLYLHQAGSCSFEWYTDLHTLCGVWQTSHLFSTHPPILHWTPTPYPHQGFHRAEYVALPGINLTYRNRMWREKAEGFVILEVLLSSKNRSRNPLSHIISKVILLS